MNKGGAKSDSKLTFDVDDLPDPAFSVTLSRRIVTWNAAAERFFSLRTADAIGHYCFEVVAQRSALHDMPCASCALAAATRKRDTAVSGAGTQDTWHVGGVSAASFRTFSARSPSGEVQLVHLLTDPYPSSVPLASLPPRIDEHVSPEPLPALLTPREREVLRLLADGMTTAEIAARLSISRVTARNHVTHVMDKLDVKSRLRAVVVATQKGLL
jgi:DNA-binding CsgD family transcriptional regulator